MRMEIKEDLLADLESLQYYLLMIKDKIFIIHEFEVEKTVKIIKGNWFRKGYIKPVIYLTNISIAVYSDKYKKWGYMTDDNAEYLLYVQNLRYARNKWVEFRKSLELMGFEIIKTEYDE